MTGMIRGLLAATALASLATTAFAQDVQGVIGGLPTELKAQYDGAPPKGLPSAWGKFT
ncbi:ribose ABC transporter substrate-binding protein, partial [Mesorhizobium sp. M7A.T.Ca.TU.009.01.3.2]